MTATGKLTLGPLLFQWAAERKREFYFRIADEAPVDTVYLGEVICSKRVPLFQEHYDEVTARLTRAGKKVVFCSLAKITSPQEHSMTEDMCGSDNFEIEANDSSALYNLRGRPHRIGQYFSVYNGHTMGRLADNGATHFTVSSELQKTDLMLLASEAEKLNVGLEVQVYGRTSESVSSQCHHARAYDMNESNCEYVCGKDLDGLDTKIASNDSPFVVVNGPQMLSRDSMNALDILPEMADIGVSHFRLSPHSHDMVKVAHLYRNVLDGRAEAGEATLSLQDISPSLPLRNSTLFEDNKKELTYAQN